MEKSKLILNELEETLQFWEDVLLLAIAQKKASTAGNWQWHQLTSPLGNFQGLGNIHDYKKLRDSLYSKKLFNGALFLPEVPMDTKHWADRINYARSGHLNLEATAMFPYMISEWTKSKKVFRVEDHTLIPLISPKKQNYLNLLPCDSFIISFAEPVEIGFETSSLIKRYKSCIVARSGKLVDTYWIPEDVGPKSLNSKTRKVFKDAFESSRLREKNLQKVADVAPEINFARNPPFFTCISFHVEQPYIFFFRSEAADSRIVDIYCDPYRKGSAYVEEYNGRFSQGDTGSMDSPSLTDSIHFHKFFFELLNGFCYTISEIKPRKQLLFENGKDLVGNEIQKFLSWNEIPITKIDYLHGNEHVSDPLKVSYGSGEKSPHIRIGHWRNIIKKDGSSERIWIDQVTVRKDKLESGETLKGNVTLLKEKRPVS